MPCKIRSKAQMRLLFAKERRKEIPKGTTKRLAKKTNISKLPERKKKKSASITFGNFEELCQKYCMLKAAAVNVIQNRTGYTKSDMPMPQIPNHKAGLMDIKDEILKLKKDMYR